MSNDENTANDRLAPSIRAKMIEVSNVRYLNSVDNLTEKERRLADGVNCRARASRRARIEEENYNTTRWTERLPIAEIAAWAMHPAYDVFVDLLEADKTNGKVDRIRLPGVSVSNVKARIDLVNRALAHRLEEIEAQETERGPAR